MGNFALSATLRCEGGLQEARVVVGSCLGLGPGLALGFGRVKLAPAPKAQRRPYPFHFNWANGVTPLTHRHAGRLRIVPSRTLAIVLIVGALFLSACDLPAQENPAGGDRLPSSNTLSDESSPIDREEDETTSQAAVPAGQTDAGEAHRFRPEVVTAHNQLGYRLLAQLVEKAVSGSKDAEGDGPGNVVLSPISVALALSLAQNGAAGETALEMAQAMQLAALSNDGAIPAEADAVSEVLNTSNLTLINALAEAAASGDIRLKVANALWYREQLSLLDSFKKASETFYQAQVLGLDFSAPWSVEQVNAWANDATEGLIPRVVDELPDDLAALIANAVYFQGDWQTPFDPSLTQLLPFHLPSGERPEVPIMYRSGSFQYYEGQFQAVRLPYGPSGRVAMYVFLPPPGETIDAFASRFDEVAAESFGRFRSLEGEVWLPRLDVSFKSSLKEPLQNLGMQIAFDPKAADFSRMIAGSGPGDFFIGEVLHQAVLKVDETGTEAAAVTSIEVRLTSAPAWRFSFRADRPFLLALRDDETGALLFIGAVVDPRS